MKQKKNGLPIPRLPDDGSGLHITKIEAARRQFKTAIQLWFGDADPVSIHTLVFAAYGVVHDLNRQVKGPPLLLDADRVRPEYKQAFIEAMKESANFFKHSDNRGKKKTETASTVHRFHPETNEALMAFVGMGLAYLEQAPSHEEEAFFLWQSIHHPELLTDEARSAQDALDAESLGSVKTMKKRDFFNTFMVARKRS